VEDTAFTMSWDKDICSWALTNQAALKPVLSEAQQQIIDLLESDVRNFTTAEIAEATGIQKYEVSRQAAALAAKGLIEKPVYGQWKAKDQFASLQSPREMQTTDTVAPDVTVTEKGRSVENTIVSTPSNGQPDIPDGITPEEYRECYNTAYSIFINEGLPPDEADRKAREEIRKFIAGYIPPGSEAAASPPACTEVNPPITPDEEVNF
jgi:DNA-binding Lrp family transcriptional regulator